MEDYFHKFLQYPLESASIHYNSATPELPEELDIPDSAWKMVMFFFSLPPWDSVNQAYRYSQDGYYSLNRPS
jgi:hypothetical protein